MIGKILNMAVLVVLIASIASAGEYAIRYPTENDTKDAGVKVVQLYMNLVVQHYQNDKNTQSARVDLLSREWMQSKVIDPDLYLLNDVAFEEYRVLGVTDNYVTVKGFNRSNSWARIVKFKIVVENGKYVIQPSHVSEVGGEILSSKFLTVHWTQSELIK